MFDSSLTDLYALKVLYLHECNFDEFTSRSFRCVRNIEELHVYFKKSDNSSFSHIDFGELIQGDQ